MNDIPSLSSRPALRMSLAVLAGAWIATSGALAQDQDGIWSSVAGGNWTDTGMWSGGNIANGPGFTADFSTLDPAADVTVSLNGDRTIGNLVFGDTDGATAAGWTLAGNTLTLGGGTPTITVNTLGTGKGATLTSSLASGVNLGVTGGGTASFTPAAGNNDGLTGGVTVSGAGSVLELRGNNFGGSVVGTGTLAIEAGAIVRAYTHNTLGQGAGSALSPLVINGGTFEADQYNHVNSITMNSGTLGLRSGITQVDGMDMRFRGVNPTITSLANAATATISSRITANVPLTITTADGAAANDLAVSGVILGSSSVTKEGPGTLAFSAPNTYSGGTTVNGGRLWVSSTLRNTSGITVNNGATVELGTTNMFVADHGTAVNNARVLTVNGSTLLMNGSMDSRIGNVTLNNAATWTSNRGVGNYDILLANTTTGAATVSVTGTGASAMNGTGGIHLQGVQNFAVADVTGDSAADLTVSMELAGPGTAGGSAGGVSKTGAGTMTLTRAATYTGGTTIHEGVVHLNGGTGGSALLRGTVTVKNGAELRLSGGDGTGLGYASSSAATQRVETLNIEGGLANCLNNIHFYYATLNLTGGTMQIGAGQSAQFGNVVVNTLASAATATLAGDIVIRSDTWNSLTPNLAFTVQDGAAATDLLVSGSLQNHAGGGGGNSNVIKNGTGAMALTGNNTYAGTTAVNAGTLLVNGSQNLAAGLITVAAGATLGGSGTMGSVDIAGDGILSPGNSAGTITVGALGLDTGSILDLELGDPDLAGSSDRIVVSGYFNDAGGKLNVSLAGAYTPVPGDSWLVMTYTTDNSLFGGAQLVLGTNTTGVGLELDVSTPNEIWLVAVPEPASGALFALALVLLCRRRKR